MRRIPNIVNVDRLVVASQFFPICFTISMTSKRSSGSARVGVCGAPVDLPIATSIRVPMSPPAKSIPSVQSSNGMGDFKRYCESRGGRRMRWI